MTKPTISCAFEGSASTVVYCHVTNATYFTSDTTLWDFEGPTTPGKRSGGVPYATHDFGNNTYHYITFTVTRAGAKVPSYKVSTSACVTLC